MHKPFSFGADNQTYELVVDKFAGVDFTTTPTKVDFRRSPSAKNMIADETYFPVKRTGYKSMASFEGEKINGLFKVECGEDDIMLCHAGTKLYKLSEDLEQGVELWNDMSDDFSTSFTMGGKLYILDGETYLCFDGESVKKVSDIAFTPTTTILATPSGAGTPFEAVNLLTPKRINTFCPDGIARTFKLDTNALDEGGVITAKHNGVDVAFSVNKGEGTITTTDLLPASAGIATLVVTFSKTTNGYADKINKCTVFGIYGGRNDTRVFLSGNMAEKNTDWQSGLYDPTYFPDTGYTKIGSDTSAIMGYVRQFDSQIVVKEGGTGDATQYLRTFMLTEDGGVVYPLRQGADGVGALSKRCFATLTDIPLMLSADGVYGVMGTNVTEERNVKNVSKRINARLIKENNLKNGVAVEYDGKYYLCINGNCYVADSRQGMENSQFEWYFFDNIPARCFCNYNDFLLFGTADGKVMRFYKDWEQNPYNDDGKAIDAMWATPLSPLSGWGKYKTVTDFYATLMPYERSSVEILYTTDEEVERQVMQKNLDIFSFLNVDFSRFTFKTIFSATPFRTFKRVRRIFLFQGILRNAQLNESFGILSLTIKYQVGNNVK